jgi:hypothetical protein
MHKTMTLHQFLWYRQVYTRTRYMLLVVTRHARARVVAMVLREARAAVSSLEYATDLVNVNVQGIHLNLPASCCLHAPWQ